MHITRTQKEFVKIGKYHDLYVQSDTVLLADVIKNFQNTLLKVYEVARQAVLKKTRVK